MQPELATQNMMQSAAAECEISRGQKQRRTLTHSRKLLHDSPGEDNHNDMLIIFQSGEAWFF